MQIVCKIKQNMNFSSTLEARCITTSARTKSVDSMKTTTSEIARKCETNVANPSVQNIQRPCY